MHQMTRTVVSANPWNDVRSMEEIFEKLLSNPRGQATTQTLPIDVTERDGALIIKAAVPGVGAEELQIQVEQNVLSIRGEFKSETSENEKVYRREIGYGPFVRSLRIPEGFDLEKVDAVFSNGVVTISIPKSEEQKPKTIQVNVRS